jgi:short-subunit dehydrogenase
MLAGRVALVTGATSGIGEAAAIELAQAGAAVMVAGRDAERAQAVVSAIRARGGVADVALADVRDPAAPDAMVAATVATFGRLDLAFNSAGIFDRMHAFDTYDDASWDEMIAVNLSAVFRCMRAEIRAMLDSGPLASDSESGSPTVGVIVNNASTVGHRGSERASPAYVAAKHGVIGLTRQAALQYVNRGIRVNAVSPGPTDTPVARPLREAGPDAVREALSHLNPTGRFVSPEEIARTVVFLCSDAAVMINGHDIPLDGGQLARL